MKTLKQLIQPFCRLSFPIPAVNVSGLSLDSRTLQAGDLFFAFKGSKIDSRRFIPQVIEKGAAAILCDVDEDNVFDVDTLMYQNDVPIITVPNMHLIMSAIAGCFFDNPSKSLQITGITGTNGKTSCSFLLAQALKLFGQKSALIGSCGYAVYGEPLIDIKTKITTPDPIHVQSILYDFYQQGVQSVTMETSSDGLVQGRVRGVDIDTAIFTNLTRDHLVYHGDMVHYALAKRQLFEMASLKRGIFNLDDEMGARWIREFQPAINVCGFTVNPEQYASFKDLPIVSAEDIQLSQQGIRFHLVSSWGSGDISSRLLCRFNVKNLLAVIGSLLLLDYPLSDVLDIISQWDPVVGRAQVLGGKNGKPLVIIDNSHTPDALKKVLMTLREICKGRLSCVVGCGGDRDKGKRPIMSEIAERLSDRLFITEDNLRTESSAAIIADMMAGLRKPNEVTVEPNRAKAIAMAIRQADAADVILVAGKGHERYQIVGTESIPFNEPEIIQTVLNEG
jgi:UDP-N-acetylmuramoyl-L-alanyl-D-glutamate--2,6-diaminopimelate ligase